MLGYLLARQSIDVIVVEKHKDFLRDFRGDTVHPSTLEVFHELGLLDKLLARPHQKTEKFALNISGHRYEIGDFGRLNTRCKFIAMMPQWDFLDVLADEAESHANFQLLLSTKAVGLLKNGKVIGIKAKDEHGEFNINSTLTIAADGRNSTLREKAKLKVKDLGAPIDVFWMRIPRIASSLAESAGSVGSGGMLIQINRGDYWQCAMPFPKGSAEAIRAEGLVKFHERIKNIAPHLSSVVKTLKSWDQIKLLNVQMNQLEQWWREGFLCIGDAAHAMSPVGGIGINLAIQDAVAAAKILALPLREGYCTNADLKAIQKRRAWPAKITQGVQVMLHNRVLLPVLNQKGVIRVPFLIRLLSRFPIFQGIPARAVGLGLRPEHWDDTI